MLFRHLRPGVFFDSDPGAGGGGGAPKPAAGADPKPAAGADPKPAETDWKAKYDEEKKEREEITRRFTEADQSLRGAAKDAKLAKELREAKEAGDTKKVLELLELDPMLVAADTLPSVFKPPEEKEPEVEPDWAKSIKKKLEEQEKREEQRARREADNARLGMSFNFLQQEGLAERYPHLATAHEGGQGMPAIFAQRMQAAETEDGYRPDPAKVAAALDKEFEQYEDMTIPMWAKNKRVAEKMVKALRDVKAIPSGPSVAFPSLSNSDQGGTGDKVDTSKMSEAERLKFNLEMAKARVKAREERDTP